MRLEADFSEVGGIPRLCEDQAQLEQRHAVIVRFGLQPLRVQLIVQVLQRIHDGGAHFFLATLAGSKPKILGGDSSASHDLFERCLKINHGQFLMTYLYYARSYAVQTQNRELFEQCLSTIDATSLDILPEARLSNAIAKKKAKLLREKIDKLF